jgi:hypothetical protein
VQQWEYTVVYVDYRGRISMEGEEIHIGDERRTAFVRRFLDTLGVQGWELTGIQPLGPHDAYYIFKRPSVAAETPSRPQSERASDANISAL